MQHHTHPDVLEGGRTWTQILLPAWDDWLSWLPNPSSHCFNGACVIKPSLFLKVSGTFIWCASCVGANEENLNTSYKDSQRVVRMISFKLPPNLLTKGGISASELCHSGRYQLQPQPIRTPPERQSSGPTELIVSPSPVRETGAYTRVLRPGKAPAVERVEEFSRHFLV